MENERNVQPAPRRPYEEFGLTEKEHLYWRVNQVRFEEILNDKQTLVHEIKESTNNFGEFLFVTTSRPGEKGRICITFYGAGYHEYRERWIYNEWFWYQANSFPDMLQEQITKEDAEELLRQRKDSIMPNVRLDTQTDRGYLFEMLADLTDEDGALAEMEDLEVVSGLLSNTVEEGEEIPPPPTGENLLDLESREKLPALYSGEEQGLDALAQVKFFTPDAQWTWYASEFDGNDIFFGLVNGLEIELGYFSLKELQEVTGPWGLPIERDLYYEPRSLRELKEKHQQEI